jgi:hypothetical protein
MPWDDYNIPTKPPAGIPFLPPERVPTQNPAPQPIAGPDLGTGGPPADGVGPYYVPPVVVPGVDVPVTTAWVLTPAQRAALVDVASRLDAAANAIPSTPPAPPERPHWVWALVSIAAAGWLAWKNWGSK